MQVELLLVYGWFIFFAGYDLLAAGDEFGELMITNIPYIISR